MHLINGITEEANRCLVVVAHPDDDILGAGGLMAKLLSRGVAIKVLFLGEGVSARFRTLESDEDKANLLQAHLLRKDSCERALSLLGITDYKFCDYSCCKFDSLPLITLVREIEMVIDEFCPDLVLTHNMCEVNIDHKITYNAVETACRPIQGSSVRLILGMEVVCSGSFKFNEAFSPNLFVDISEHWEAKLNAWRQYEYETKPFPFPRSDIGLETLARYRGMQSGLNLAEAFKVFRWILRE